MRVKLSYNPDRKDPIYYAQHSFRDASGRSTTENIRNFGHHSELLKITDDPLAYVKAEIAKMNADYAEQERQATEELDEEIERYNVPPHFHDHVQRPDGDEHAAASQVSFLNIGYFFLQSVMKDLHLKEFFRQKAADRKMPFDCYDIWRFLTYDRILYPKSKLGFVRDLPTYFEQPDIDYQHVLRFMDLLQEEQTDYLRWLFQNSQSIVERDTSILYYDCTDLYFETEEPDEDYRDEVTGEVIYGLRKYGFSKEHRPDPLVEMGLFVDGKGIPLAMCLHPGSTSEQVTAIPMEEEVLKMLDGTPCVYCADAGLGSYDIRLFNRGRSFIVTRSIKELGNVLQDAVFNDYDYRLLSNDERVSIADMKSFDRKAPEDRALYDDQAYKILNADRAVDTGLYKWTKCQNGSYRKTKATGQLPQRVIITFSRKMMEYDKAIRAKQIERALKLMQTGDPGSIKKGPNDVRRFIKRVSKSKSGDPVIDKYELDMDKIAEEEKYDGYYAIATNLDDPPKAILEVAHKRYQIEGCFRVIKSILSGRPVNHQLAERIQAHFLLCYTALLVLRLLETKLDDNGTHVTTRDLITTMQNLYVKETGRKYFKSLYFGSDALDALTAVTGLGLDMEDYKPTTLRAYIRNNLK